MGEAEEPLWAQTLPSDAHIEVQKQAKKSGALEEGGGMPPHSSVLGNGGGAEGSLQNHPPKEEKHCRQLNLCLSQESV